MKGGDGKAVVLLLAMLILVLSASVHAVVAALIVAKLRRVRRTPDAARPLPCAPTARTMLMGGDPGGAHLLRADLS
jgi:hypothetical protein